MSKVRRVGLVCGVLIIQESVSFLKFLSLGFLSGDGFRCRALALLVEEKGEYGIQNSKVNEVSPKSILQQTV